MNPARMIFKETVLSTDNIKQGYCSGLKAMGTYSIKVVSQNPRKLSGSVDIDHCTRDLYPTASRWDYVVGYDEKAYFIEVHPACTSNIGEMIKKKDWLSQWLAHSAKELKKIRANDCYYWIPSGKVSILSTSPQSHLLAKHKIKIVNPMRLG